MYCDIYLQRTTYVADLMCTLYPAVYVLYNVHCVRYTLSIKQCTNCIRIAQCTMRTPRMTSVANVRRCVH